MKSYSVTVRCIPSSPSWIDSFYVGNLIRGLEEEGIAFDLPADESGDFLSARWLRGHAGQVDLLHFHWTHYHYTAETWARSASELAKFIGKIALARRLGYKIVWTMHNYLPHERTYPWLHCAERFLLARLAHAVIVHCDHGRILLQDKLLRRGNVFVAPLGNFGPHLVSGPTRQMARGQLGFTDSNIVFCYFGMIRPYKQVPQLIREFRAVAGDDLRLVIIGATPYEALETEILDQAAQDPRVQLRLEHVSDEDLATYLQAADVAVLPYRDVLGSGSAMLALSSGLPVVAPRMGCLAELITPDCGVLYEPGSGAIAGALEQSLELDLPQMSRAAQARARQFPWETMVQETAQIYRRVAAPHSIRMS